MFTWVLSRTLYRVAVRLRCAVRVKSSPFMPLILAAMLWATGAAPGCKSLDAPLGRDCNQSCAALCVSMSSDVDDICGTSLAEAVCVGSGHEYCSKPCANDNDCQPAERAMRCLTSCLAQPEFAGLCWSEPDWTSLTSSLCR